LVGYYHQGQLIENSEGSETLILSSISDLAGKVRIYDKRAVLVYWEFLESKGSSNLTVQKRVIEKAISLFSEYKIVILGDREFCSVTRLKMARGEGSVFLFETEKEALPNLSCQTNKQNAKLKNI